MNRYLLVLLVVVAAAVGGLLLARGAGDQPAPATPSTAGDAAAPNAAPRPRSADARSAGAAEESADAAPAADPEPPPAGPTGRDPRPSGAGPQRPVDLAALRAPYKMRRLGWPLDHPQAEVVSRWVEQKLAEDQDLFEEIEHAPDRDKPEIMRRFNAATDARRRQLVQSLGVDGARAVADEWCLYHFEPERGSWHRIDIEGNRVPFKHGDDDIWQGFERSDPSWNNHRSR